MVISLNNDRRMNQYDDSFWLALDKLVAESKITIDRPKGSRHPKYPDYVYPFDYGYLENTFSPDSGGLIFGEALMATTLMPLFAQ